MTPRTTIDLGPVTFPLLLLGGFLLFTAIVALIGVYMADDEKEVRFGETRGERRFMWSVLLAGLALLVGTVWWAHPLY